MGDTLIIFTTSIYLGRVKYVTLFTQDVNFENPYINRKSSLAKIKELGDNVIKMLIMIDIFQTFQFL